MRVHGQDEAMSVVEESVEVEVPAEQAYEQWTRFDEFPQFLEGVHEVREIGDGTLHWRARVAAGEREWDATIAVQEAGRRIGWTTSEGPSDTYVTVAPLEGDRARVTIRDEFHGDRLREKAADALGLIRRQIRKELANFKALVESP
jgi:uncharacterized membrane protein